MDGTQKTTASPSEAAQPERDKQPLVFAQRLAFLERKGKELYGEHFRLHGEDYPLLETLLAYATGKVRRDRG